MPDMLKRDERAALAIGCAIGLAMALAGCTYTDVSYGDARLVSWRLWTDTSASLTTPELDASYSSDADTAAAASMNQRLLDALIGSRLVATGAGL